MQKEEISFHEETIQRISAQGNNEPLANAANNFLVESIKSGYSYNFTWMGRPVIQYPQDLMAMQELIWKIQPDLIIETGVAHGGSLIFYASILELIGKGEVLGIDIDIRPHNRTAIESHPMAKRIQLIQGSSVAADTISTVKEIAAKHKTVIVCLDSNHTHEHVYNELKLYSGFVSSKSYLVVFDTLIEDLPIGFDFGSRPWKQGDNPKSAIAEFLKTNNDFEVDKAIDHQLLISVAPGGFLRRKS